LLSNSLFANDYINESYFAVSSLGEWFHVAILSGEEIFHFIYELIDALAILLAFLV